MKKYDYSLETTNLNVFSKLVYLFLKFDVYYVSLAETNDDGKIYKILYNEDYIDACANKDKFLDKLEDLAIRYNL